MKLANKNRLQFSILKLSFSLQDNRCQNILVFYACILGVHFFPSCRKQANQNCGHWKMPVFVNLGKFFLKKKKGYILDVHTHYPLKIMACIEKEQNRENRGTNRGAKSERLHTVSILIRLNYNSNRTQIFYCFLLNTIKLHSLLRCSFWNRCKQLKNFNQNVLWGVITIRSLDIIWSQFSLSHYDMTGHEAKIINSFPKSVLFWFRWMKNN